MKASRFTWRATPTFGKGHWVFVSQERWVVELAGGSQGSQGPPVDCARDTVPCPPALNLASSHNRVSIVSGNWVPAHPLLRLGVEAKGNTICFLFVTAAKMPLPPLSPLPHDPALLRHRRCDISCPGSALMRPDRPGQLTWEKGHEKNPQTASRVLALVCISRNYSPNWSLSTQRRGLYPSSSSL